MVLFTDVKLTYTCPATPPENVFMDRIYSLNKDEKGLYFTDGNYVEYADESYIKMLFSPKDTNWDKVDFTEKVETIELTKTANLILKK